MTSNHISSTISKRISQVTILSYLNFYYIRANNVGKMKSNTAEMKNYLHKLIVETDDESILYKVQAYFLTLKKKNIDWWDTISNQEKEIINLSLQQLENDEGIPHEEVKRKVDKLFGR